MKIIIIALIIILTQITFAKSFFDFSLKLADGGTYTIDQKKTKAILVTNIATQCGFTGQLEELEKIYQEYKEQGLLVIGIPSNDFGSQTPEGNIEVKKFCKKRFGTTFPILEKMQVSGDDKSETAKFLTDKRSEILWNFEKFLLNSKGEVIDRYRSMTSPTSRSIKRKIKKLLKE